MHDAILYASIVGFLGGVLLGSLFPGSDLFLYGVLIAALCIGATSFFVRAHASHSILATLILFSGLLGLVRIESVNRWWHEDDLASFVGTEVSVEGVVVEEADVRETTVHLTLFPERVSGVEVQDVKKVLVFAPHFPVVSYGDRVTVVGTLRRPEAFITDTGNTFQYPHYLRKEGIGYQISFPTIVLEEHNQGNPLYGGLFAVKRAFLESLRAQIPEPHVSLLGGLLVGAKQSLGEELLEHFRVAGLVHIVVLSGYNITIVAKAIMNLFGFFPRSIALVSGVVSIVGFAIMTGGSATVVRASLMALLVLLAEVTSRTYVILKALLISGFLMVVFSPYILLFDPSFQLSFLATFGLIVFSKPLERYVSLIPERFGLRSVASATLATQVMVLPLLLYMTGTLSLFALPANLLALLVVPFTMLLGFLTGVFGFISATLALPFAYVSYLVLEYLLTIVSFFSQLPFAKLALPMGLVPMLCAYLLLFFVAYRLVRA